MEQFPEGLSKILGVAIGQDTVVTIRQKLGDSAVVRVGESQGSEICYRSDGAKGPMYLVFEFGPLGGFDAVTGYRVAGTGSKRTGCADLKGVERFDIPGGLHLGMTKSQFRSTIGAMACESSGSVQYSYEGKRKMNRDELARFSERNPGATEDPFFDVRAGVLARFGQSGLVELSVYMTESY